MAFGFFNKIKEGLEKTRKSFVKNVETVIIGYAEIDDDFLDDLEAVMLTSDLGPKTTEYLMKEIRRGVTEGIINNTGDVMPFMEDRITEMLVDQEDEITLHHPEVILVVGVNGVGKTTTIAKLANYYTKEGKKVIIAAGDTFRAAAADQLSIWADRVGVPIVKHKEGADPAAVVYDAMEAAKARNADLVIVDTAGSLVEGAKALEEFGAKSVTAAVTHAVLTDPASERIANSNIKELIVTNTMPLPENCKLENVTQLSVAPLLGEAIMRIFHEVSVSNLFDK